MRTKVLKIINKFKDFGKIAGIIGVIINGNAIFVVIPNDILLINIHKGSSL